VMVIKGHIFWDVTPRGSVESQPTYRHCLHGLRASQAIHIYLIPLAALGPGVDSASKINEYQESSWRVKHGRHVRLTTSLPSVSPSV
jgi:hypothetical protein